MGWLFTKGLSLKEMTARRVALFEFTQEDGSLVVDTCLKHCYRGGRFSGILWSVRERTISWNQQTVSCSRYINCDLLKYQTNFGWGYKDMNESYHPYYYSCPLGYLALAEDSFGRCDAWREGVREYHAQKTREKLQRQTQASEVSK